jgi:hypothetical protein
MEQFVGPFFRILFLTLFVGGYFAAPVLLVWSWVRWMRSTKPLTFWPILSLIGLSFVSASALCAVSLLLYSRWLGGSLEHFDDRLFMGIFQWGKLLSRIALAFGIAGVWRPSPLRWHSPVCTFSTLMFWLFAGGD